MKDDDSFLTKERAKQFVNSICSLLPLILNLLKAGDQNTEQMETTYGGTERMFGSMRLEALEFLATLFGKSLDSHL